MACIGGEARRIVLWCAWVLNMLVTSIFYCLAFATTASLVRVRHAAPPVLMLGVS
jgi:hypothetical protein